MTSIFFVGNLKKALAQSRDGLWHMRIIKLSSCGMLKEIGIFLGQNWYIKRQRQTILKEIGIFLGQNWYIKLHQCSVIGNIYSQRILGNLEFLHKKISSIVWNCKRKKESYFQYKISNVRPYIHNLSAMKLTNCVEIKLSAPPTAKGGLQLLFK